MPDIRMPDGQVVRFPDDMPAAQIKGMIAQKYPREVGAAGASKPMSERDTSGHYAFDGRAIPGYDQETGEMPPEEDTLGAYAGGLRRGAESIVGGFGDVGQINASLLSGAARMVGLPQGGQDAAGMVGRALSPFPGAIPTDVVRDVTDKALGPSQQPRTTAEKYAGTMGEFGASALAPGGFLRKLAMTVVPSVVSETAGQATEGTAYEPYARLAGGVLGGVASALPMPSFGAGARNTKAMNKLLIDMRAAGKTADEMKQALANLGDDAALIDLPEFQQRGQRIYANGGEGRQTIRQFLEPRDRSANARIRQTLDDNLGPAPLPSRIEADIATGQSALSPVYEGVFRNARRVDTQSLADDLDSAIVNLRGRAQRSVRGVRDMLNIVGTDQLDPNPRTLFETRKAIDGLVATETDPNALGALFRARSTVDDMLANAVPNLKEVDAQFAELARQRDAFARGQQVLDSGRTAPRPADVADDVAQGVLPQGRSVGPSAASTRLRQGTRAELDRLVGTNANDRVALKRAVKGEGDWNREKMGSVFGPDRVEPVFNRLDAEEAFSRTTNRVMNNSATAERLTPGSTGMSIRDAFSAGGPKAIFYSTAVKTAETAIKRLGGRIDGKTEAEIARLLTTTERNKIFNDLLRAGGKGPSQEQLNTVIRLAISAPAMVAPVK